MQLAVAIDILHTQRDHFGTGHSSQLRNHAVTTEGDRSNRGSTAEDRNLTGSNRSVEGEDRIESAGAAVFHA